MPVAGLSPRVRGNRRHNGGGFKHWRSIPACAGEPWASRRRPPAPGVYPRVCGGTGRRKPVTPVVPGLSPRVRGNRWWPIPAAPDPRSIPACAGEPCPHGGGRFCGQVYPRVCGGTAHRPVGPRFRRGLSPRVRGNRRRRPPGTALDRSIPACAGEPFPASTGDATPPVYPRVCGGTLPYPGRRVSRPGLSPRVRGNPLAN